VRKLMISASLLVLSGCGHVNQAAPNEVAPNQAPLKQTKIISQSPSASHDRVVNRASSISTARKGKTFKTYSAPGAPGGIVGDLLNIIENPTAPGQNRNPGITPPGQPVNPANPAGQTTLPPSNSNGAGLPSVGQAPTGDSTQFANQVLELVNTERTKAGLSALTMDDQLSKMAMAKAQDMHNNHYFDHNSPTHGSPFDMMREYGITYQSAGENIANGQPTPAQVMNDWMNSPEHKANILNSSYSRIGIAYYNGEWVQEFTG